LQGNAGYNYQIPILSPAHHDALQSRFNQTLELRHFGLSEHRGTDGARAAAIEKFQRTKQRSGSAHTPPEDHSQRNAGLQQERNHKTFRAFACDWPEGC
jgi:hypothetical protein